MSIDKQAKQHLIDIRNELIRQGQWATCTNCMHWGHHTVITTDGVTREKEEWWQCNRFNMIPPEDVIVVGCVNHEPEVPF